MNRLHTCTIEAGTIIPLTQSGVSACVVYTSYIKVEHNITYKQVIDNISAIANTHAIRLLQSSRLAEYAVINSAYEVFSSSVVVVLARTNYATDTKLYADITEKLHQTQLAIANIDKTLSSINKDLDIEAITKVLSCTTDCAERIVAYTQKECLQKSAKDLRAALEKKLKDYAWQLRTVRI